MAALDEAVKLMYAAEFTSRGFRAARRLGESISNCDTAYIEIPITPSVFEVPLFAVSELNRILTQGYNQQDAIVACLKRGKLVSRYTTVNRIMQDALRSSIRSGLVPVSTKGSDGNVDYFVTSGAIFDRHLNALAICSWLIENNDGVFGFVKPVLRVNPSCYLNKSDQMEKFIVNKLMDISLTWEMVPPTVSCINRQHYDTSVKVEISESPFAISKPGVPSINTTTSELIQIAIDHRDEIVA